MDEPHPKQPHVHRLSERRNRMEPKSVVELVPALGYVLGRVSMSRLEWNLGA